MKTRVLTPYHFFLKWAGYSYDPKTETPFQGRQKCAKQLAQAERYARDRGATFTWTRDYHGLPNRRKWGCIARDCTGNVFASLWGIDFKGKGTPWDGDPYRRVVEAELACELLPR